MSKKCALAQKAERDQKIIGEMSEQVQGLITDVERIQEQNKPPVAEGIVALESLSWDDLKRMRGSR